MAKYQTASSESSPSTGGKQTGVSVTLLAVANALQKQHKEGKACFGHSLRVQPILEGKSRVQGGWLHGVHSQEGMKAQLFSHPWPRTMDL